MDIKVVFNSEQPDTEKAQVATRICQAAFLYIDLPVDIVVEFVNMGNSSYGEVPINEKHRSKIRINSNLSIKEIIYPIVHELVHLNQIHTGKLSATKFGKCVWNGVTYDIDFDKLTYEEYCNLPWEQDVKNREKELLKKIVK